MAGTFSSNSHIQEAVPFHFIARVDIPEINQKGTSHTLLDQIEIERPKSILGQSSRVGPIGTRVWSITIDDMRHGEGHPVVVRYLEKRPGIFGKHEPPKPGPACKNF